MLRFILLLLLIGLVLAIRYLPWQVLVGGFLVLVATFYLLRGWAFVWLFSLPFRAKGAVLRGATATVHYIRPTDSSALIPVYEANEDEQDEPDAGPRDAYELEATITPGAPHGPFRLWEVGEIQLVEPNHRPLRDDSSDACTIVEHKLLTEVVDAPTAPAAGDMPPDGDPEDAGDPAKVFGPHRLRFVISVRPGVRRLVFAYYFEKFGEVTIPPRDAPRLSG